MTLRAFAFALAYLVLPAAAHDFWLDHSRVDPRTKLYCCGENDCHLLPVSQAHATKGGYLLDDTSETIAWDRVQPSPDGGIWACRWGGETKMLLRADSRGLRGFVVTFAWCILLARSEKESPIRQRPFPLDRCLQAIR